MHGGDDDDDGIGDNDCDDDNDNCDESDDYNIVLMMNVMIVASITTI